jgi:hypothetical protein
MSLPRLLVVAALSMAVVACGAEDPRQPGSIREAAARSARVEIVNRHEVNGRQAVYRSTGIVDFARDRSEYWSAEPFEHRSITIGETTFSQSPLERSGQWVRTVGIDHEHHFEEMLAANEGEDGPIVSMVFVEFASDERTPTGYVDYLRGIGAVLEPAGQADVRGLPTERLRTSITQHAETRYSLQRAGWKQANIEKYLETLGDATVEVEVFVDTDGVVRRIVETTTPRPEFAFPGLDLSPYVTTTEFFDFGIDAEIEAPPADEVVDAPHWDALREQAEGSFPIQPFWERKPDD